MWILNCTLHFSSVTQSCPTLQPHGLQYSRLSCPSPTLGACSNSCPSNQWCHPTISSSGVPFSSCLQSFPASRSFPMSQSFASGDQSTGASASAWKFRIDFLSGWLVWSPSCPRDSQQSSPTPQFKSINSPALSLFTVQHSHPYMTTGKKIQLLKDFSSP